MANQAFDFDRYMRSPTEMTEAVMESFATLLYEEAGIALNTTKRNMVSARLGKRLRALNLETFDEYLAYLNTPIGRQRELDEFVDVMTTNKTEFFRERSHYDTLINTVLPAMKPTLANGDAFSVWSAGCSTGEEPYSLAMLLYDQFLCVENSYSVFATDICRKVLSHAEAAVYAEETIKPVPTALSQRFLLRGKGHQHGRFRVAPEIRRMVQFDRLNLMDDIFGIDRLFHAIWCRNVMIYFDTPTKIELTRKLCRQLVPGGFLFVGHSESLNGLSDSLQPVVPAVYRKGRGGTW